MKDVYIVQSCRTAIGSFGGSLKQVKATELGAAVIQGVLHRGGVKPEMVDQIIMGNVLQAGQGQNPARQAAIKAGIPVSVPAMTINKVCGSGLTAVNLAAALIRSGQADCMVVGGFENMSQAPHVLSMRWGNKMGDATAKDVMIQDGLWDAFHDYHMGMTAENVARQYGITREAQDQLALLSQKKAAWAQAAGKFREEIVPVEIPQKKGDPVIFQVDEYIRKDATLDAMARLRPAFCKEGTVTAANASGINDGAAALLIASESFVQENGLSVQARWVSGGSAGVPPELMGIGPVPSVRKALCAAGMQIKDIQLIEANEAFAAQAAAVIQELKVEPEIVNVNGGAIALGHPIGASGARIAVTLIHEMAREKKKYGLATLCIGGGMGEATIFSL